MSDEDNIPPEDRELEAELKRLGPSPLKVDFLDELIRDQERIAESRRTVKHSKWMLPTLVTCAVVFCGTTLWKIRGAFSSDPVVKAPVETPKSDFVPISTEGYLLNASSGGIIESENGPRERFELNYEDVQHWHNPDTATNIRIFSPRREIVTIPLQTD